MTPQEIFILFKNQQGSDHIAGKVTIEAVVSFCKKHNPQNILELGGGIGTLSYAILKNCDGALDIYEHNDFCIRALNDNLREMSKRYTVTTDYLKLPPQREYDLIIIDGGKGKGIYDGGFPQVIASYISSLNSIGTIFIEGRRKSQRFWVAEALRARFLYTPTHYEDPTGGKKGALRLDCKPCSNEFLRTMGHLYWRKRIY
ncbi:MAG: hypothetical protein A3D67_04195 [Candidatus Lloydbacteria bacterium RIFCSPHIGHO2_02_FULL_51_22]|uniref:Uncharacterized protein n=2 Tax=Candidatus Lloydiibacteriota TaxID=1817910 RepID=A0A1G2DG46_9BACT|nr:MAG: hypothetical protein A3D67_04195 [Candidatus Lloydbacteria bacterium RIFCSPHIGHO2_02_FULL_51_22]OGZ17345.1 MAG: hypothetical protein A3G11_00225 [Candidatus Lloydbacteria bacterium RIFCSPLOWO2_12_FULL_51_9]